MSIFSKKKDDAYYYDDVDDQSGEVYEGEVVPYNGSDVAVREEDGAVDAMAVAADPHAAFNRVCDLYSECVNIREKSKQMKVWGDVKIAQTVAKYNSCRDYLERSFGERDKALGKHYSLLDDAVKSGDKELILAALQGISSIVTSSPLENFDEFVKLYQDESQPLLDF